MIDSAEKQVEPEVPEVPEEVEDLMAEHSLDQSVEMFNMDGDTELDLRVKDDK